MYDGPVGGWAGIYLCGALVFAALAAVLADRFRGADAPGRGSQSALIVLAGALWPVVAAGLLQLGLIRWLAWRVNSGRPLRSAEAPVSVR